MEPAEVLPKVAAAGYSGFDLSATWRDDLDPGLFPAVRRREIRKLSQELGLGIEALVTHLPLVGCLHDGRPLNLPGAVDLAGDLGCPLVTVHIGSPSEGSEPGDRETEDWRRTVAHLQECCDYAAPFGISIACDALYPTFMTSTPESVAALLKDVGRLNMGHNYDPCYLHACGFSPVDAAQVFGPHILHAHVKDSVGRYPGFQHRIPGEGEVDHAAWVGALQALGFSGAVAVECFPDMPLEQALAVGHRTLAPLLRG
jgi:sugar phosphate isomerase/epimerase